MLVVEETSQKLLGLYRYERGRVAMGSMSEATYRNNARLLLEGDDCFQVEPLTRTPTLTLTPTPTLTLTKPNPTRCPIPAPALGRTLTLALTLTLR